ncbi:MAG: class I SAM-dependent methyltransferase, partial [Myxococcota bacterium]|nr:class I SAM-dependent methyltransferase [Myxococcota bacterium]
MTWTEAERQLLVAGWNRAQRRRHDPEPLEAIQARANRLFTDDVVDLAQAVPGLLEQGLLVQDEDRIGLGDPASDIVPGLLHEHLRQSFEMGLVRLFQSQANAELSRRVYGTDLQHLNMVDHAQMEHLLDELALKPGEQVVDLGCATGAIAERLSDDHGVQVTGLDFARPAIAEARRRTAHKADRLSFVVGDLNALDLPAHSFDVALSVDTLYFVTELESVVGTILGLVRPGGRLAIFWSQNRTEDQPESELEPGHTAVARALDHHGARWHHTEFTEQGEGLW